MQRSLVSAELTAQQGIHDATAYTIRTPILSVISGSYERQLIECRPFHPFGILYFTRNVYVCVCDKILQSLHVRYHLS